MSLITYIVRFFSNTLHKTFNIKSQAVPTIHASFANSGLSSWRGPSDCRPVQCGRWNILQNKISSKRSQFRTTGNFINP